MRAAQEPTTGELRVNNARGVWRVRMTQQQPGKGPAKRMEQLLLRARMQLQQSMAKRGSGGGHGDSGTDGGVDSGGGDGWRETEAPAAHNAGTFTDTLRAQRAQSQARSLAAVRAVQEPKLADATRYFAARLSHSSSALNAVLDVRPNVPSRALVTSTSATILSLRDPPASEQPAAGSRARTADAFASRTLHAVSRGRAGTGARPSTTAGHTRVRAPIAVTKQLRAGPARSGSPSPPPQPFGRDSRPATPASIPSRPSSRAQPPSAWSSGGPVGFGTPSACPSVAPSLPGTAAAAQEHLPVSPSARLGLVVVDGPGFGHVQPVQCSPQLRLLRRQRGKQRTAVHQGDAEEQPGAGNQLEAHAGSRSPGSASTPLLKQYKSIPLQRAQSAAFVRQLSGLSASDRVASAAQLPSTRPTTPAQAEAGAVLSARVRSAPKTRGRGGGGGSPTRKHAAATADGSHGGSPAGTGSGAASPETCALCRGAHLLDLCSATRQVVEEVQREAARDAARRQVPSGSGPAPLVVQLDQLLRAPRNRCGIAALRDIKSRKQWQQEPSLRFPKETRADEGGGQSGDGAASQGAHDALPAMHNIKAGVKEDDHCSHGGSSSSSSSRSSQSSQDSHISHDSGRKGNGGSAGVVNSCSSNRCEPAVRSAEGGSAAAHGTAIGLAPPRLRPGLSVKVDRPNGVKSPRGAPSASAMLQAGSQGSTVGDAEQGVSGRLRRLSKAGELSYALRHSSRRGSRSLLSPSRAHSEAQLHALGASLDAPGRAFSVTRMLKQLDGNQLRELLLMRTQLWQDQHEISQQALGEADVPVARGRPPPLSHSLRSSCPPASSARRASACLSAADPGGTLASADAAIADARGASPVLARPPTSPTALPVYARLLQQDDLLARTLAFKERMTRSRVLSAAMGGGQVDDGRVSDSENWESDWSSEGRGHAPAASTTPAAIATPATSTTPREQAQPGAQPGSHAAVAGIGSQSGQ